MEAGHCSETPTPIYQNRRSQTPQYTICSHYHQNVKSPRATQVCVAGSYSWFSL